MLIRHVRKQETVGDAAAHVLFPQTQYRLAVGMFVAAFLVPPFFWRLHEDRGGSNIATATQITAGVESLDVLCEALDVSLGKGRLLLD